MGPLSGSVFIFYINCAFVLVPLEALVFAWFSIYKSKKFDWSNESDGMIIMNVGCVTISVFIFKALLTTKDIANLSFTAWLEKLSTYPWVLFHHFVFFFKLYLFYSASKIINIKKSPNLGFCFLSFFLSVSETTVDMHPQKWLRWTNTKNVLCTYSKLSMPYRLVLLPLVTATTPLSSWTESPYMRVRTSLTVPDWPCKQEKTKKWRWERRL